MSFRPIQPIQPTVTPSQNGGFRALGIEQPQPTKEIPSKDKTSGIFGTLLGPTIQAQEFGVKTGIGALKGLGSTIFGAGKLVEKGLRATIGKGVEKITGKELAPPSFEEKPEILKPKGTAEEIGFKTEQVAEFFGPGAVLKGTKIALTSSAVSDVLKILGRVGLGATETASVMAVQEGTPAEIAGAGAFGALIPGGPGKGVLGATKLDTKVVQPVMKFLTEKLPSRIVNSILKPVSKMFDFGRDPGKGVVGEGIVANTRGGLLTKISQKKKEIGESIGGLLETAKAKTIDLTKAVLEPIDKAIAGAVRAGEQALVTRLQSVKDGLTKTFKLGKDGKIEITGNQILKVNPTDAHKMKVELGANTRWTGQAFDNDVNQVRVQVYRNMNNLIDDAVEGVKPLQQRYANLLSAEKAMERTNKNIQRLVFAGLRQTGVGGIGFGASLLSGESAAEAVLKGVATGAAFKFAGSTAVKTRAAQGLKKLAPSEQEALFEVIPGLRNFVLGITEKGE